MTGEFSDHHEQHTIHRRVYSSGIHRTWGLSSTSSVSNIQFRLTCYLLSFSIIFYFLVSRKLCYVDAVVNYQYIQTLACHAYFAYKLYIGKIDQYTMTILLQGALVVTGPQLIHLSKFQRRTKHRRLFYLNTIASCLEYWVASFWFHQGGRNLNICSTLQEALHTTSQSRLPFIGNLLILSVILSITDVVVASIDGIRNKGIDRKAGDHSIPTLPRGILWESAHWTVRRGLYFLAGFSLYCYTIYAIEALTVRDLAETIAKADGISIRKRHSNRDFAQLAVACWCGLWLWIVFCRYLTEEITWSFAKREVCKKSLSSLLTLAIKKGTYTPASEVEGKGIAVLSKLHFILGGTRPRPFPSLGNSVSGVAKVAELETFI